MKTMQYLLVGVFAVIILYYMAATLQSTAEPTVRQAINFVAPNNNTTSSSVDLTYPVSLYNTDVTCTAGNYSYNATHVTLLASAYCEDGDYTFQYTHRQSTTVFGMDLAFVAILVFLGVGIYIVYLVTKH